jgi:hypothetical protein
MFGFRSEKIACGHRKTIRNQVRKSHHQDDPGREPRSDYTTDYGKGSY